MKEITPADKSVAEIQNLLQGGIGPRPIALVSTISPEGIRNLSPFSFFNVFSARPPIVAFSAARRGRDASLKDTYNNIIATKECVIQAVTYEMVEQVSLSSHEYTPEVDEFLKCGLTPVPSALVRPFRVMESPFQMECKLIQMVPLGEGKGAGNLAICEVVLFHVSDDIFEDGIISPFKIDLVSRMSGDYYCRANGETIFKVAKPGRTAAIGFDSLPESLVNSGFFTKSELARLAGALELPSETVLRMATSLVLADSNDTAAPEASGLPEETLIIIRNIRDLFHLNSMEMASTEIFKVVRVLLRSDRVDDALLIAFIWQNVTAKKGPDRL